MIITHSLTKTCSITGINPSTCTTKRNAKVYTCIQLFSNMKGVGCVHILEYGVEICNICKYYVKAIIMKLSTIVKISWCSGRGGFRELASQILGWPLQNVSRFRIKSSKHQLFFLPLRYFGLQIRIITPWLKAIVCRCFLQQLGQLQTTQRFLPWNDGLWKKFRGMTTRSGCLVTTPIHITTAVLSFLLESRCIHIQFVFI